MFQIHRGITNYNTETLYIVFSYKLYNNKINQHMDYGGSNPCRTRNLSVIFHSPNQCFNEIPLLQNSPMI
jgi:hypothetical protein